MRLDEITASSGQTIVLPVTLTDGSRSRVIVNPTRSQFEGLLRQSDMQQVRVVAHDHDIMIGDSLLFTHHGMVEFAVAQAAFSARPQAHCSNGFLQDGYMVFWGMCLYEDFWGSETPAQDMFEVHREFYDDLINHPGYRRLYPATPRVGFLINDGKILEVKPDRSVAVIKIDLPLEN